MIGLCVRPGESEDLVSKACKIEEKKVLEDLCLAEERVARTS